MNKPKRVTILSFILCAAVLAPLLPSGAFSQDAKPMHAPDTLPGVEPEMLSPDYWAALHDDADEIIMTPAEITVFNEKVRGKSVTFTDYYGKEDPLKENYITSSENGLVMNLLSPLDVPDTVPGDDLRERLAINTALLYNPKPLYGSSDYYDGRNAIYDTRMKDELAAKMNTDAVPPVITPRFGIVVNHALVRQYPTAVPGYSNTTSTLDRFQLTDLCVGNPVAVLHESASGDYLFVVCPLARGWIAAPDVAFGDRAEIRAVVDDPNFLMSAGHRVPVYGDPGHKNFARYMYFSATMPLISRDRTGYRVKMPTRRPDGSLEVVTGYIKPDADVSVGYLPYTKRNVLGRMFNLLGTPYGWHGQDNKRDCAGTVRVLLRSFGIKVGKNPAFILNASDHVFRMNPELSEAEKIAEASKLEPVITMAGNSGHIVMFLGKAANGKLYYIHQAGWGYRDDEGIQRIVGRVTINWVGHGFYSINAPNVWTTMRK
ncbi:SH3 domain-containing protein [Candidatus Latescibacterota bacterium]